MVVRNKYGGYWNKTRSTVDSGGSSIPCMISMTNIFSSNRVTSHITLPCHTRHNRPDGDRRQTHAYPRQRFFPGSCRYACNAHEGDYHHKCVHFQQHGNQQHAPMHMIISHEITSPSKCGGVIKVSTITPKYYAGVQNACLQCVERQGALQNF